MKQVISAFYIFISDKILNITGFLCINAKCIFILSILLKYILQNMQSDLHSMHVFKSFHPTCKIAVIPLPQLHKIFISAESGKYMSLFRLLSEVIFHGSARRRIIFIAAFASQAVLLWRSTERHGTLAASRPDGAHWAVQ